MSAGLRKRIINIDSRYCARNGSTNPSDSFPADFRYAFLNPIRHVARINLESLSVVDASAGTLALTDPYYFLEIDELGVIEHQTTTGTLMRIFAKVPGSAVADSVLSYQDNNVLKDVVFTPTRELSVFKNIRLSTTSGATVQLNNTNAYIVLTLEVWEVI
jgi:hypothetical protein